MNKVNQDVGCTDSKKDLLDEKLSENLSCFMASSTILQQTAPSRKVPKPQSTLKMEKPIVEPMKEVSNYLKLIVLYLIT